MRVVIREAIASDADALDAVRASGRATLRETYRPNQQALANKQAISAEQTTLVAEADGRVVGAIEYSVKSDRVHFLSLDVLAEYRRQGVAAQLIEELARISRSAGMTKLSTYTVVQTGNCEIFQRLGFRIVSEEPSPYFESDRFAEITEAYLERPIA